MLSSQQSWYRCLSVSTFLRFLLTFQLLLSDTLCYTLDNSHCRRPHAAIRPRMLSLCIPGHHKQPVHQPYFPKNPNSTIDHAAARPLEKEWSRELWHDKSNVLLHSSVRRTPDAGSRLPALARNVPPLTVNRRANSPRFALRSVSLEFSVARPVKRRDRTRLVFHVCFLTHSQPQRKTSHHAVSHQVQSHCNRPATSPTTILNQSVPQQKKTSFCASQVSVATPCALNTRTSSRLLLHSPLRLSPQISSQDKTTNNDRHEWPHLRHRARVWRGCPGIERVQLNLKDHAPTTRRHTCPQ